MDTRSDADARCLARIANALIVDPELIRFLRDLAPQWGSNVGKTRSYGGLPPAPDGRPCILRVDSRVAILLNDVLYSAEDPSPQASHLVEALRHLRWEDTSGHRALITPEGMPPIHLYLERYADAEGQTVPPGQPFHHRVIALTLAESVRT